MAPLVRVVPLALPEGGRGEAYGRAFAADITRAVGAYRRHFATIGIAPAAVAQIVAGCAATMANWSPRLLAELDAIAAGAGLTREDLLLLTARTEVLAAAPEPPNECTALADTEAGFGWQTWDWYPELVPTVAVIDYRSDAGLRVRTVTEPGMLAKIGVNSAGVGVMLNYLAHTSDRLSGGAPIHALLRQVLDEADSLEAAAALIEAAPVSASSAITVVADSGQGMRAVTFEVTPERVGRREAGVDGRLAHSNHFLDPGLALGDRMDRAESAGRYWSVLAQGPDAGAVCARPDQARPGPHTTTLITAELRPAAGLLTILPWG